MHKHRLYIIPVLIIAFLVGGALLAGNYSFSTSAFMPTEGETILTIHNHLLEAAVIPKTSPAPVAPTAVQVRFASSLPILMYHEIGVGPNSLYVSENNFRAQMVYLHDNGYQVVTMTQAQEMLAINQIPSHTAVITFDDGYVSFYNHAWPILREFGFPATVYVITNFVGMPNYLSWDQITTLQTAGIEIGCHTQSHPSLITLAPAQMTKEIQGSKDILEAKLGVPVQTFCYPSGDCNPQVVQVVKAAGYTSAVTVVPRQAASRDNPFLLPRLRVPGWASLSVFAKELK